MIYTKTANKITGHALGAAWLGEGLIGGGVLVHVGPGGRRPNLAAASASAAPDGRAGNHEPRGRQEAAAELRAPPRLPAVRCAPGERDRRNRGRWRGRSA